jgi:hypothetical protein
MKLLKLTEYKHSRSTVAGAEPFDEVPLLVNPVGIESVAVGDPLTGANLPIVNKEGTTRYRVEGVTGLTVRSGRKHALVQTFEEFEAILDAWEGKLTE